TDGDGFDDLFVGAFSDDNNGADSGSARVLSGANGSTLYTFDGDAPHTNLGSAVSNVGDIDGDGVEDLIAGAMGDDAIGLDGGAARVYSGINGATLFTFHGDAAGDLFGRAVSGAGDVNGDGTPDLVVGAPFSSNAGVQNGLARVFSGVDGSVLGTMVGDSAGDQFGISVSGAGDTNLDRRSDVIVGAWLDGDKGGASGSARVFSLPGAGIPFGALPTCAIVVHGP
ncbi:MAG: FG-GAP repeat protein, partial [Myxococcales bacterium]|nr:FG-GAP repeat protein [Myxococcales bacterium]